MAVVTSSLTGALVASHRSKRFHLAGCGTLLRRLRHAVLIRAAGRTQWAKFETIAHSVIDLCVVGPFVWQQRHHRVVDRRIKGEVILGNRIPGCCAAVELSDHSIEAARHTTKYQLIGRPLVGYLRKLISGPTAPNANARSIAPHDAPGLRFRHTAVDACLVAVRAFYQTRRKPVSPPF